MEKVKDNYGFINENRQVNIKCETCDQRPCNQPPLPGVSASPRLSLPPSVCLHTLCVCRHKPLYLAACRPACQSDYLPINL